MKKTLLPFILLLVVATFSACGPAANGKKVAEKFCECSMIENMSDRNDCNTEATIENEKYRREYLADKEALKEYEEAFESHRDCKE